MSSTPSAPICPHCGFSNFNPDNPRCECCGAALSPERNHIAAAAHRVASGSASRSGTHATDSDEPPLKKCPHCGFTIFDPDLRRCEECGGLLPAPSPVPGTEGLDKLQQERARLQAHTEQLRNEMHSPQADPLVYPIPQEESLLMLIAKGIGNLILFLLGLLAMVALALGAVDAVVCSGVIR